ncbi:uL13 family ribosomal protein [Candidatus Nasuia deltocephalinicola]|uniref:uL13 family ribosomal protein n=1 Tax=Candidatus Nasuia deltocephalincola TaxID=1160784 RepID=UPI00216ACD40|nr:uL13 family ribosomal protein [Candidatus Nasuia deltocephalinicola]
MKNKKWYIFNIKNKTIGKISKFIIKIIKIKCKIILINENFINFYKKKYKNKFVYKHTGYIGNLKKKNYIKIYDNDKKELILNSLLKMFKNNKSKKFIKKNIKFFKKNNKNIKFYKSKILYI